MTPQEMQEIAIIAANKVLSDAKIVQMNISGHELQEIAVIAAQKVIADAALAKDVKKEVATLNTDYRLYLDERFSGLNSHINAQFLNAHEKLESIEKQTIKTNGRVGVLEKQINVIEVHDTEHAAIVIQGVKIEAIEKDLEEYRFFKKYPKIAIGILGVFLFLFGLGMYEIYTKTNSNIKQNIEILRTIDSLNYIHK